MLPLEVLEKLSQDMNIAFNEAKVVARIAQDIPDAECLAALLEAVQETAASAQKVQAGLITLLLSVLAHGAGSNHKLDAA